MFFSIIKRYFIDLFLSFGFSQKSARLWDMDENSSILFGTWSREIQGVPKWDRGREAKRVIKTVLTGGNESLTQLGKDRNQHGAYAPSSKGAGVFKHQCRPVIGQGMNSLGDQRKPSQVNRWRCWQLEDRPACIDMVKARYINSAYSSLKTLFSLLCLPLEPCDCSYFPIIHLPIYLPLFLTGL